MQLEFADLSRLGRQTSAEPVKQFALLAHGIRRPATHKPQEHVPVCAMTRGWASLAHLRSQLVLVPEQLREQLPVQVMWQVAPPVQLTLPLVPTVSVQVDPFVQFGLQEVPQLPVQVL